jgi:hypothetical protein
MPVSIFGGSGQDYKGQGLSIKGLQEAQRRNLRRIAGMQPGGIRGQAVQWGAAAFLRQLTGLTPVDTGALRASRRITFNASVPRAQITDSGSSYNPRSRTPPHEYDVYLHARGGAGRASGTFLASYPETMSRHGQRIVDKMHKMISDWWNSIR